MKHSFPLKYPLNLAVTVMFGIALASLSISVWQWRWIRSHTSHVQDLSNQAAKQVDDYQQIQLVEPYLPSGRTLNKTALDQINESSVIRILEEKIRAAAIHPSMIMMEPRGFKQGDGVSILPVQLRLSPVPADRLQELLTAIQMQKPVFRIENFKITRLQENADELDVELNLQWIAVQPPL